jgi:hypothetical protein
MVYVVVSSSDAADYIVGVYTDLDTARAVRRWYDAKRLSTDVGGYTFIIDRELNLVPPDFPE